MTTVCAVVLTYNRQRLLERCLEALAGQTRRCERILVIDNGSSDDTVAMVRARWADTVVITTLPRNIGAAGGFTAAIRAAYETDCDFAWVMDDDVIPDPDALEQLVRGEAVLAMQGIAPAYLISRARSNSGELTDVPDLDRRPNRIGFPNWAALLDRGLVPTRGATFVSILLPRDTIERHGLPLPDMFMWGEDREYTVRISRDVPGFLVGGSTVLHARETEGQLDIRTERNPDRIRYHYYMIRNTTFTTLRYERKRQLIYLLVRQAKLAGAMLSKGRWYGATLILSGVAHGFLFHPAALPAPQRMRA